MLETEIGSALLVPLHLLHPPYYLRETDIISSSSSSSSLVVLFPGHRPLPSSSSSLVLARRPLPWSSRLLPGHRPRASSLVILHLADARLCSLVVRCLCSLVAGRLCSVVTGRLRSPVAGRWSPLLPVDEAFDIKMKITAYWKIVILRLVDSLALYLQTSLSNLLCKEMEEVIVKEFVGSGNGSLERLLFESLDVARKRAKLNDSVNLPKESKLVLSNAMNRIENAVRE
ncbi:hypothetical protein Syun_018753 [Stephania yunnanensis]|uniref:GED domain-containing protein n=1 Tax=Stephania yunnanensis TaxID=152371 RepID=A0AAP0NYP9_9MAGN